MRNCSDYLDERKKSVKHREDVNSVGRHVYDFVRIDCSRKRSEAKGDFSLDVTSILSEHHLKCRDGTLAAC